MWNVTESSLYSSDMLPISRQDSMFNGSSVLDDGRLDYPNFTFEVPPSCKTGDMIWPLVYFTEQEIVDLMFFKFFEKFIITILFPIVFTFGFIGNLVFLAVLALVKEMHTITNFYLANLAVADLLYVTLQLVSYAITYALSDGLRFAAIFRKDIECGFFWSAIYMTYFTSLCLVTLVSLERFLAICYPLKYRRINTQKRSIVLVIIAWIIGIAIGAFIARALGSIFRLCLIWPSGGRWQKFPNLVYFCWTSNQFFTDALLTAQTIPFITALTGNTYMYGKIISRLSNRKVTKTQDKRGHSNTDKIRNTVARMLIANGIIFFLCLAPFQFVNLLDFVQDKTGVRVLDQNQNQSLRWFAICLLLLNSTINPYVYGIANRRYRKAFIKAFSCGKNDNMTTVMPSVSGQNATDDMAYDVKDSRL